MSENKKEEYVLSQDKLYDEFLEKAYELYKQDWCSQRGYILGEENENGFNGELYVCKDEFADCEFNDENCMKSLLDSDDFVIWKSLNR